MGPSNYVFVRLMARTGHVLRVRTPWEAVPRAGELLLLDEKTYKVLNVVWEESEDGYGGTVMRLNAVVEPLDA